MAQKNIDHLDPITLRWVSAQFKKQAGEEFEFIARYCEHGESISLRAKERAYLFKNKSRWFNHLASAVERRKAKNGIDVSYTHTIS